jgi:hypothetical protein
VRDFRRNYLPSGTRRNILNEKSNEYGKKHELGTAKLVLDDELSVSQVA